MRSYDRSLSEGISDRYELVFELGGLVTDCCRDRDRIFELAVLVHVPVLLASSIISGWEGGGPGEDEVESLARLARKDEGACRSEPVRFSIRGKDRGYFRGQYSRLAKRKS